MHQCYQLTSRHELTHAYTQPKSYFRALRYSQIATKHRHIINTSNLQNRQCYLLLPNYCNAVLEQQTACTKTNTAFLLNYLYIAARKQTKWDRQMETHSHSLWMQVTRSSFFLSANLSTHTKNTWKLLFSLMFYHPLTEAGLNCIYWL